MDLYEEIEQKVKEESEREFDNNYLPAFKDVIWSLDLKEEKIQNLPNESNYEYERLVSYLLGEAGKDASDALELLEEENDSYYKEILRSSKFRIEVFEELLEKYKKKNEVDALESDEKLDMERHFLFLNSGDDGTFFQKEIKKIVGASKNNDVANDLSSLLDFMRYGDFLHAKDTQYKVYTDIKSIKGVREVKDYQSRIYFLHIKGDFYIVIGVSLKKGNLPKDLVETLSKRKLLAERVIEKEKLKEKVQDKDFVNALFIKEEEIFKDAEMLTRKERVV